MIDGCLNMWDIFDCKLCYCPVQCTPGLYRFFPFFLLPYSCPFDSPGFCHVLSSQVVWALPDLTPTTLVECVILSCKDCHEKMQNKASQKEIDQAILILCASVSMSFSRHTDTHHQTRKKSRNTRIMIPARVMCLHSNLSHNLFLREHVKLVDLARWK